MRCYERPFTAQMRNEMERIIPLFAIIILEDPQKAIAIEIHLAGSVSEQMPLDPES